LLVQFIVFADAAAAGDPYPLRLPDTSSPRATLQGFIGALDEAYVRFAVLMTEYAASNRLYFDAEEWRSYREAFASGLKAVQFGPLAGLTGLARHRGARSRHPVEGDIRPHRNSAI
jgi:hypothetical protein